MTGLVGCCKLTDPQVTMTHRCRLLWMSGLDSKWVRFTRNRTNPGLFQIRFQYILAHRAKMYWNLIWKSPGFVLFGANMTHFGAKTYHLWCTCEWNDCLIIAAHGVTIICTLFTASANTWSISNLHNWTSFPSQEGGHSPCFVPLSPPGDLRG